MRCSGTQMRHQDSVCRQVVPMGSKMIQAEQQSGEKLVQSQGQVTGVDKSKRGQEGSHGHTQKSRIRQSI